MNCPSCQHPLPDEALFCSSCGLATAKILKTTIQNSPETNAHHARAAVDPPDPRIGLVLDSKYQLIERLGQGGMGAVYRAKRLHIGDEVAVKLLSHDLVREQQAIERFRREARSAALIRHPNVVSIHDFSDQSTGGANEAYIVMELVKGMSLRSLLEREGRFTPERAVALMLDICAGVGVAHRQGLLHRDLKPDNVIVSPPTHDGDRETAKVVDFGLAKVRDDVSPLTQTGTLMGTIYYMSPEQCRGEELDARTDVYSLGAMFYEMVSGGPPFRANNLTGLITKHLHDIPPPFDPSLGIPARLASVCFRALAKDREQRQADARVFSKELQTAASTENQTADQISQITVAHQPSATSEPRRSGLLKWAIIAVPGLLVGAVLIGVLIWAAYTWRKSLNPVAGTTSSQNQQQQTTSRSPDGADTNSSSASVADLRGTWTGTYGPLNNAAKLVIKNHNGEKFDGVLEQGSIRVAFEGTIQGATLTMKQTKVVSGEGWDLGDDSGTIEAGGKRMSGTGKDSLGGSLGITYPWTFSRK